MHRSRTRTAIAAVAALALTLPFVGCDDGPSSVDDGRISIMLTDAPGDVDSAVVRIEQIYLQGEGDDGRVILRDTAEAVTTNLLELVNDAITLVDDAVVPAGTYGQLRFVISEACIVGESTTGETGVYATTGFEECGPADGTLNCPSCSETGIKVNMAGDGLTVTGEQRILLVDFDVAESFGPGVAGASGMWVMNPVIRASDLDLTAGLAVAVSLADTVTLPEIDGEQVTLGDFEASLADADGNDEGSLTLGDPDDNGVFEAVFQFLDPAEGPFEVDLETPDGVTVTTDPSTPVEVDVESGQEAETSITVTSASTS